MSPLPESRGVTFFQKKLFIGGEGGGKLFGGTFMGVVLYWGTNDQIISFTNAFSSIQRTVFPNHGEYSLEHETLTNL